MTPLIPTFPLWNVDGNGIGYVHLICGRYGWVRGSNKVWLVQPCTVGGLETHYVHSFVKFTCYFNYVEHYFWSEISRGVGEKPKKNADSLFNLHLVTLVSHCLTHNVSQLLSSHWVNCLWWHEKALMSISNWVISDFIVAVITYWLSTELFIWA